jgi:phage baseplate assembly protein W
MYKRTVYTINKFDLDPSQGIGVALPFNPSTIFDINYTSNAQIKSNLLNFMLTNKGERVMNPTFGADIRKLIFEQMEDFTEAKSNIIQSIYTYFPTVTVNSLDFNPEFDTNTLKIVLNYTINNKTDRLVIQIS